MHRKCGEYAQAGDTCTSPGGVELVAIADPGSKTRNSCGDCYGRTSKDICHSLPNNCSNHTNPFVWKPVAATDPNTLH